MSINRDNYQVWITDYYDGSLSDDQESLLLHFLNNNPDLQEEFDLYGHPALFPNISLTINKESLKKDIRQLKDDQKEYLLVSLTEGDLSDENASELAEYIENDPLLAEKLHTLKNIRLTAPDIQYPYKNRLKRIPVGQATRTIVLRALSIAAAATILISIWVFIPSNNGEIESSPVAYSLPDISEIETEALSNGITENSNAPDIAPERKMPIRQGNNKEIERFQERAIREPNITEEITREPISIVPARIASAIDLQYSTSSGLLAEMSPAVINEPSRPSSPREFFAKNLRELILKDTDASTDRLKVYEVADVTLHGVNKVLGWNMKLDRETDSEGNINNLRFTSQLVKFDHKIKNVTDVL